MKHILNLRGTLWAKVRIVLHAFPLKMEIRSELWPSGYGRRFVFWRSWVKIPVVDGHFSHWLAVIVIFVDAKDENKQKRPGMAFFKKRITKILISWAGVWSSGYGRQLMFERSWVQNPAPYTGWTFFTLIHCKNWIVCLERPKINEKEAEVGPFS